jgi:aspartate carbamoyltransferase catalytic subunit
MKTLLAALSRVAEGRILATLFFEPSTRTRLSFESAMLSLGGRTLGFSEAGSSSVSKGESLPDTIRMAAGYADAIVIRHPLEGAAMLAATASRVPVINAGDGGHAHPTQTLTDMLTLLREKGGVDGLTIGLCGDLKYGRTVHSLIRALGLYTGVKIVLIAPPELRLPAYMKAILDATGMPWHETADLTEALPELDVLYMTRIQRERFDDAAQYARLKDSYVLDGAKMARMRGDARVLHPLPRVTEIAPEVDADPRAAYFRQAENGRYIRMALLEALLLGKLEDRPLYDPASVTTGVPCGNPRSVVAVTPGARPLASHGRCLYCEHGV